MKKNKIYLVLAIGFLLLGINSRIVRADDGTLQMNTGMITGNQSGVGVVGDFPIRSELFLPTMNQSEAKRANSQEKSVQNTDTLSFGQKKEGAVYKVDIQPLQNKLFHNYQEAIIPSDNSTQTNSTNNTLLIFGIVTIPLSLITAFVAQKWTRRKRKSGE